jgi:aminoglycoside 6'-N-acetyltransferase I
MQVRRATPDDIGAWSAMRHALWPDAEAQTLRAEAEAYFRGEGLLRAVFVAGDPEGGLLGMLELSLRPYADGCISSPVPYVEGWYVAPDARRRGCGRALVAAAERWAIAQGHTEIASDALIGNRQSENAHKALGFGEVERVIHFRKALAAERGG